MPYHLGNLQATRSGKDLRDDPVQKQEGRVTSPQGSRGARTRADVGNAAFRRPRCKRSTGHPTGSLGATSGSLCPARSGLQPGDVLPPLEGGPSPEPAAPGGQDARGVDLRSTASLRGLSSRKSRCRHVEVQGLVWRRHLPEWAWQEEECGSVGPCNSNSPGYKEI